MNIPSGFNQEFAALKTYAIFGGYPYLPEFLDY